MGSFFFQGGTCLYQISVIPQVIFNFNFLIPVVLLFFVFNPAVASPSPSCALWKSLNISKRRCRHLHINQTPPASVPMLEISLPWTCRQLITSVRFQVHFLHLYSPWTWDAVVCEKLVKPRAEGHDKWNRQ